MPTEMPKTKGFLVPSGSIIWGHGSEMGQYSSITVNFEHVVMSVGCVRACVRFAFVPYYSPLGGGRTWR